MRKSGETRGAPPAAAPERRGAGKAARAAGGLRKAALAALLALALLAAPAAGAAAESSPAAQLQEVFAKLEALHVGGMSAEALRDAAVNGMLQALDDPYTQYYHPDEWRRLLDSFEQKTVGIGIRFIKRGEGLLILRVYEGSAAADAGLRAGDVILEADGQSLAERSVDEAADLLVGPEGSSVRLTVADGASGSRRSVAITRRTFQIPSVDAAMAEGGIGVVRIGAFSSDTARLTQEALETFRKRPDFRGLVLDLRGNPGGYLDAAAAVASLFIEEGTLLYTVGRDGKEKPLEIRGGSRVPVPVAVLVDGNSASASEVFAGALQDYKAAVIVGTKTYGKGSVQRLVSLETGGGLRVTVEHYKTPSRRTVEGAGIVPDIEAHRPLEAPLAAFRALGARGAFRVELKEYETAVNGAVFSDIVPVLRRDGLAYVSSRALAAVAGGEALWDGAKGEVRIRGKLGDAAFGPGGGLLVQNGASYIEIGAFAKAFRGVRASVGADAAVLEWSE